MNPDNHECKLRNKIIEDGDCYETVMAVNGLHSKTVIEKLLKEYPKAKEVCLNCKFNLDNEEVLKVYQSESDSYIEKRVIGKYKYIGGESTIDLVKDKVYFRVEPDNEFRIVDDSGEDYLYNPDSFEKVE